MAVRQTRKYFRRENMNIIKIVEEELGQELQKAGFQLANEEKGVWTYERVKNGVKQVITVITSRYSSKKIKVLFDTNAYGQNTKEFYNFVPEEDVKNREFWGYKNEEELRNILREFRRLIVTYGFDFLETISKPTTDAVPTEEMERYLYLNHQKLYEEYSEQLHTQEKSVEEVIEIIYQVIEQNGDEPFENVKDLLIGLTALYGHTICWGDKGNWAWKGKVQRCWLTDILGTDEQTPLLSFVFSAWDSWREDRRRGDTLFYIYRTTLVYYYRMHPEKKEKRSK